MGDWFQVIVDLDATPITAPRLADGVIRDLVRRAILDGTQTDCILEADLGYPPGRSYREALVDPTAGGLSGLWTNGCHAIVGHTVFDSGQGAAKLRCPSCDSWADSEVWLVAVDEWWNRSGPAVVRCPHCGTSRPLPEWSSMWAFAELGFNFWNWPKLSSQFVADLSEVLDRHRLIVVEGKL